MTEPSLLEESLFLRALELGSAEEQAAFLDRECTASAELRRSVEALLRHHREGSGFLESPPTEVLVAGEQLTAREAETPVLDFLAPSAEPASIGRLGHYEILEVLGSGGFGVVLKASDTKLNRIVAIKVLAPELASNPTARKRFQREAHAAAAVVHQHVVTIHAVEEDRFPYLVMECIDGQSLKEKIDREGQLQLIEIVRIGQQVAAGLAAAHAHGLMHRDVKPANILLENGVERVRITDFGLARAVDDVGMTRTGEVAGTPQYMSPEQAQGLPMDVRSDLFSFGCVLYAMCTGRPPFRADSTPAVLHRVCHDTPRPIQEINREIPDWLIAIVDRLLEKQPADRFQSAEEIAALLGQHLAHLQQPALMPRPEKALASPRKATKRWQLWSVVAVIALLAVACAFGLTEASGVTAVVPTVIRIVRGEGAVVVEVNDPGVKVTVEGDGGLVITGAGLEEIRLRPGGYRVHADKDGKRVPLEREEVTIAKGGVEVVKVKLEAADTGPTPTADGFTPLFDGNDLTGWAAAAGGTGKWKIEDGALTCTGPRDHLLTTRNDFGDFHLRAVVKVNANGNSGIYFRTGKPLVLIGDYEAQITNNPGQGQKTGSLFDLVRVSESPVPPDTWFTLEIIAVGKRIQVLVNGKKTAAYTENRAGRNTNGHIALQHYNPETQVFFRKIEIKELPAAESAAAGAFVVLGGKGVAARKFDTLAQAVESASAGDTIEVRGNGPFVTDSISIHGKALTIRAAQGCQPVIELSSLGVDADAPLIHTNSSLVVEGLDLRRLGYSKWEPNLPPRAVIRAGAALVRAVNCRFVSRNAASLVLEATPACQLRNCQLSCGETSPAILVWGRPGECRVQLENCVVVGRNAFHVALREGGRNGISIHVARSTLVSPGILMHFPIHIEPAAPAQPLGQPLEPARIECTESILDSRMILRSGVSDPARSTNRVFTPTESESLANHVLAWKGDQNLCASGAGYAISYMSEDVPSQMLQSDRTLIDWKRWWGASDVGMSEGQLSYQGKARTLASEQLWAGDFRLRPDSAGYRAGKDGKDLGADVDLVGPGPAYERWMTTPEYQTWLKDSGQLRAEISQPSTGAFVVLGGMGVAERKCDTLAEAVASASDGDTIEVRGNGPFTTEPIKTKHALTIRAGEGFRPVVKLSDEGLLAHAPLLVSESSLVLEGIEFQRLAPDRKEGDPWRFGLKAEKSLHIANCRFLMKNTETCLQTNAAVCELRNSEFLCPGWTSSFNSGDLQPGQRLVVENCLFTAGCEFVYLSQLPNPARVRLARNTFRGGPLWFYLQRENLDDVARDGKVLDVEASDNLFDGGFVVRFEQYQRSRVLPVAEAEKTLVELLHWQGVRNLFATGEPLVRLVEQKGAQEPENPVETLAAWRTFWETPEVDSVEGRVRYQGGDLLARFETAPEQFTPQDWRLREDSAGHRAGKDGKDLGADVDLVGPGAAYERWKKTPEYQTWLKETGQLRAEIPQPEAGAFVRLGSIGVAERKFDTLAQAVESAGDGDTIEVRGNGPYVTESIEVYRSLTIRAGAGFRPVLRQGQGASEGVPLLRALAPVTVEGLELVRLGGPLESKGSDTLIFCKDCSLSLLNCRLVRTGRGSMVFGYRSPRLEFRNCDFSGEAWYCVGWDPPLGGKLTIDHSTFACSGSAINVGNRLVGTGAEVHCTRNTFVTPETVTLGIRDRPEPLPAGNVVDRPKQVLVEFVDNVIHSKNSLVDLKQVPPLSENPLTGPEGEDVLKFAVHWSGTRNLYSPLADLLRIAKGITASPFDDVPRAKKITTLADWKEFWGSDEEGCILEPPRFRGGNILAMLHQNPQALTPEDLRLVANSPGHRAGQDGKDLGADVDLVGPGEAYERWKATPEYQEWLKETKQVGGQ